MKGTLLTGIGLILGGIAGYFIGHKMGYQKALDDADELLDDVSDEFKRRTDETEEELKRVKEKEEKPVKEKKTSVVPQKTDYQTYFDKEKKENEMTEEEEWMEEHQKEKDRPPRIISFEDADDLPEYFKREVLFYYQEDGIMTDEQDNVIPSEDLELLLGDALDKYGFAENEEQIMFVKNYTLSTCYEVEKIDGAWSNGIEEENH